MAGELPNVSISVSISIVNWNRCELLRRCLRSIEEYAGSVAHETFVVDNASTDGSREMVRDEFPDVQLIENPENLGYGRAHNQAMRQASGMFLFLMNNDVVLLPGTLARLVDYLERHPDVGAAGCRYYTDATQCSTQPSAFRVYPTPWNDLLDRVIGSRLRRWAPDSSLVRGLCARWDRTCPVEESPQDVAHIVGAAMMTRREIIRQELFFDESFDFFFEETDWCRRLRQHGWKIAHVPDAAVVHLYSQSFAQRDDREQIHYQSYLRYLRKHEGWAAVGAARLLHRLAAVKDR